VTGAGVDAATAGGYGHARAQSSPAWVWRAQGQLKNGFAKRKTIKRAAIAALFITESLKKSSALSKG